MSDIPPEAVYQAWALSQFVEQGRHLLPECQPYGLEWGNPDDEFFRDVRENWINPELSPSAVIAEIGCGGGRWSKFWRTANTAWLIDASPAAAHAVQAYCPWDGFKFLVSTDGHVPALADASIDYVFSWDVFVHFHRELFDAYIQTIGRILKPVAKLHLHFATRSYDFHAVPSYRYHEIADVAAAMTAAGLQPTDRFLKLGASVFMEAIKCPPIS